MFKGAKKTIEHPLKKLILVFLRAIKKTKEAENQGERNIKSNFGPITIALNLPTVVNKFEIIEGARIFKGSSRAPNLF